MLLIQVHALLGAFWLLASCVVLLSKFAHAAAAAAAGPTALPAGSHVTFANSHTAEGTLQLAVESAGPPELLSNVKVDHVQLNPLVRGQLGKLDLQTAK